MENIYVIYKEKDENGFKYPIAVQFKGKRYDIETYGSIENILAVLRDEYPNIDAEFNNGEREIIKTLDIKFNFFEDEMIDETENQSTIVEEKPKKGIVKGVIIGAIATALIIAGVKGCQKLRNKVSNVNQDSIIDEEKTVVDEAVENVEKGLDYFYTLSGKHHINGKQLGLSAEEFLTAYLYVNSYDYKPYELLEILKENPEFYANMSNNYRSFSEVQTYYNILGDEPSLTKDFFKNEESYNMYVEYFNLFKKTQTSPTKENKQALDTMTKELFGLVENKEGIVTNVEENPGVVSLMGHTITTSGHLLGLISEETYTNAMYKMEKDSNGNAIKVHGPIEKATCEYIENQRLDILSSQILIFNEEDALTKTFNELNQKYNVLKSQNKLLVEEDVLNKIAEIRMGMLDKNVTQVTTNTTSAKETKKEELTEKEVRKEYTKEEIEKAEEKADEEFEEEYGKRIEQQQAKKEGLIDARDAIEEILEKASENYEESKKYSKEDIYEIRDELLEDYDGDYKTYYLRGVNEAVAWGIDELNSIKSQLEKAMKEIEQEKTTETETPKEEEKEETKKEEPSNEEQKQEPEEDNQFEIPSEIVKKPISQEELEEILSQQQEETTAMVRTR